MKKVYLFLADGFEPVEALAPVDVMRRAGIEVVTVSIMKRAEVISAQGVTVVADAVSAPANSIHIITINGIIILNRFKCFISILLFSLYLVLTVL